MTNLSIGNFGKFHFAAFGKASVAVPNGNESHSKKSARAVRDDFTLSQQSRCTYGKPVSRLDKTSRSASVAQVTEALRIFSTAPNSIGNLARFLGIDMQVSGAQFTQKTDMSSSAERCRGSAWIFTCDGREAYFKLLEQVLKEQGVGQEHNGEHIFGALVFHYRIDNVGNFTVFSDDAHFAGFDQDAFDQDAVARITAAIEAALNACPDLDVVANPHFFEREGPGVPSLGIDTINGNDATLFGALSLALEAETLELTDLLIGLLHQAGLGNEQNEIILAEDVEGNIVVEGDIDNDKRKKLETLINSDPELVERIKDHKARLEIARAIDPENHLDISSDEFAAARHQLLKSFLRREGGFSLADVAIKTDADTGSRKLFQQDGNGSPVENSLLPTLLSQMPGLEAELFHAIESLQQSQGQSGKTRSLLALNGGVMTEAHNGPSLIVGLNGATITSRGVAEGVRQLEGNFQIFEPQQLIDLSLFPTRVWKNESFMTYVERHSNHPDTAAWALGLKQGGGVFGLMGFGQTEVGVRTLRAQLQANREKIDDKITNILRSNNITLGRNETLNITVNQRGEIKVGDGISGSKRDRIEKLLNEDKTLAHDLLFTHAERQFAVMGDWLMPNGNGSAATTFILTDAILRREFGVSLNDFRLADMSSRLGSNFDPNVPNIFQPTHSIVPKGSDSDRLLVGEHDLLDKIFNEERALYEDIKTALRQLEEHGGDFEVSFAYRNGVTIEKGATDQAALNRASERFLFFPLSGFGVKASVTLDPFGRILNSQVTDPGRMLDLAEANRRLAEMFNWAEQNEFVRNAWQPTQSRLQQYAFDAQRLFQFNTGVDAATAKAMNVTFGTSGTAWR